MYTGSAYPAPCSRARKARQTAFWRIRSPMSVKGFAPFIDFGFLLGLSVAVMAIVIGDMLGYRSVLGFGLFYYIGEFLEWLRR